MRYLILISLFIVACSNKDGSPNTEAVKKSSIYPVANYLESKKSTIIQTGGQALYVSEFQGALALYYGGLISLYDQCMANFDPYKAEDCARTKTPQTQWGWPCERAGYSTGPEC